MGWIVLIIVAVVVLLIVFFLWTSYNRLAGARIRVKEAWAGIDVQLKRRSSLIPNLVETVKGYAAHEKDVLENVSRARAQLDTARNPQQAAQANDMLTGALSRLFAVAEAYPDLKANQNFLELQRELTDTEDKIAYSRQFYNTNVSSYNTSTATFPSNLIARMFGFQPETFYETDAASREEVKVSFA